MRRRTYVATLGTLFIAGCGGDSDGEEDPTETATGTPSPTGTNDQQMGEGATATPTASDTRTSSPTETESPTATSTPTESPTPTPNRSANAVLGEVVAGDNLSLVVRDVRRTTTLSEIIEADEGNEFVVVRIVAKNRTADEFVDFNTFWQAELVDDENYSYDPHFRSGDTRPVVRNQLAPGELTRGDIVFEIPDDASGLSLNFDLAHFSFFRFNRVSIDLENAADPIADLTQDLAVDVHREGDTVKKDDVEVVYNSFEVTEEISDFTQAEEGNEYIIVDVSVTNETGEEQSISVGLHMGMKDGEGFAYEVDLDGYSSVDRAFAQSNSIADGDTRRGKIVYQVPKGRAPLYWTFNHDVLVSGSKSFWQVR